MHTESDANHAAQQRAEQQLREYRAIQSLAKPAPVRSSHTNSILGMLAEIRAAARFFGL